MLVLRAGPPGLGRSSARTSRSEEGAATNMSKEPKQQILTAADVQRLMSDDSPDARVVTTAKIAAQFDSAALTPDERHIAQEIFRIL